VNSSGDGRWLPRRLHRCPPCVDGRRVSQRGKTSKAQRVLLGGAAAVLLIDFVGYPLRIGVCTLWLDGRRGLYGRRVLDCSWPWPGTVLGTALVVGLALGAIAVGPSMTRGARLVSSCLAIPLTGIALWSIFECPVILIPLPHSASACQGWQLVAYLATLPMGLLFAVHAVWPSRKAKRSGPS